MSPHPPERPADDRVRLVERLVRRQHPRLLAPVSFAARGWDEDLFRLGTAHLVRLPRDAAGAAAAAEVRSWLQGIAERLPVAIPVPIAVGAPGDGYPFAWAVVPWFDGRPADAVPAAERDAIAVPLAAALAALHRRAPAEAPRNPYRGVPLAHRDDAVRLGLQRLGADSAEALRVWDAALGCPEPEARRWVHGDLHPGNVILDDSGGLRAIIDFGDLCAGDPAVDLAAAWTCFAPTGREVFVREASAAGAYDEQVWVRARGWALAFAVGLILESDGSDRMLRLGRVTLAASIRPGAAGLACGV